MDRHEFLAELHRLLAPRTYVETGVNFGQSMTISRTASIGIDPDFDVRHEIQANVQLARTTSDEFFTRKDPLAHLPYKVIDLGFIDGMHLSEYALRDYLAIERFTHPASVIVFDDMLPRSIDEAARYRHTTAWTGDVYKAAQALRDYCPELLVFDVDTKPTGVAIVFAPHAGRGGVLPEYDTWLSTAISPDPQQVPKHILNRSQAVNPERLLANVDWAALRILRTQRGVTSARIAPAIAEIYPKVTELPKSARQLSH